MRLLVSTIPALTVLLATLVAALPWGLPPESRFFLPLLAYTVVHYWAVRQPQLMPEWLVFGVGVLTDVVTYGPVGYWSLIFLTGIMVTVLTRRWSDEGSLVRLAVYAGTLAVLAALAWGIASLYHVGWQDWRPMAIGALGALIAYPVISFCLKPIDALWATPDKWMFWERR